MNADEDIEDDPRQRLRAPFAPSEAWIEAYDSQCTEDMLMAMRRYAMYLARLAGDRAGDQGATYAEELVQDCMVDIARGVLRWDPADGPLIRYVGDVIRLRARRDREREERRHLQHERHHHHVSIDEVDRDDRSSVEDEASLAVADTHAAPSAREESEARMDQMMEQARALAADDPHMMRIIEAIDGGARRRSEIKRMSGLSTQDYRNARRRLARLASKIDFSRLSAKMGES